MGEAVLKWPGGKNQLLGILRDHFPADFEQYHEPFLGGGAVFFDLSPDAATVNDLNSRLMNFYRHVRDQPEALIATCRTFRHPTSPPDPSREFAATDRNGNEIESYYEQQRALFNRRPHGEPFDELEEAALLLYLNRTCFNGLYRENAAGEFNVPVGAYDSPDWVRASAIRRASQVLEGVTIYNHDFTLVLDLVTAGDLVYLDPPYEPMSATEDFTAYTAARFGAEDQERLLDVVAELDTRDVNVVVSNSGVMADRYEQAGFSVTTVHARRSINRDGTARGEVDEIIATNIAPENQRQAKYASPLDY